MITANIPNSVRRSVYRRDGYRCALCDSATGLEIRRIVHRSEGGSNLPQNLITLCWKCHAVAHGTRMPEYPEYVDREYIEQACVEYAADFYAEQGRPWYPFGDD